MRYTIITPAYNSWALMKKYFESLENQTFRDFEVIIIDDKSTDDSFFKINEYKQNSTLEITVIQNEKNSGPGYSRNRGIELAKGEWITFADSDDWISEEFFEKINNVINNNDCNCVVFDYSAIRNNKIHAATTVYGNHNTGFLNLSDSIYDVRNHTFCKVYKKDFIVQNNIVFPELKRCEDVAFVCQALIACKSIYYLKESLYFYNQHSGSLSNNSNLAENDMILAYQILNKKIGHQFSCELERKSISDLLYGGVLMMCKAKKKRAEIQKYICMYESTHPNWYDGNNINRLGKKKRIFLVAIHKKNIILLRILTKIHSLLIK